MNIDTGEIKMMDDLHAELDRMVLLNEAEITQKQLDEMQVSLHDHTSSLGKKLTALRRAERNKYTPHMGVKERFKESLKIINSDNS